MQYYAYHMAPAYYGKISFATTSTIYKLWFVQVLILLSGIIFNLLNSKMETTVLVTQ